MLKCELLAKSHNRKEFDCGDMALNVFLQQFARQQGKRNLSKTYVMIDSENPDQILGFYSISALHIDASHLPLTGYPKQMNIPAMLIGRLAVDNAMKGQGLSKKLIAHALLTIKQIASMAGVALVVVDAKHDDLIPFYEQLGFIRSSETSDNSLRLFMSVSRI